MNPKTGTSDMKILNHELMDLTDTEFADEHQVMVDKCKHHNTKKMFNIGKTNVYISTADEVCYNPYRWDLMIDCSNGDIEKHQVELSLPARNFGWAVQCELPFIVIPWPDFSPPLVRPEFFYRLYGNIQFDSERKNLKNIVFFCSGGHGRSGTAIACMYAIHKNLHARTAIDYVRQVRCDKCIETFEQEEYVSRVVSERKSFDFLLNSEYY